MSKKPAAALSASLVAVKGSASPAPDMQGRGASAEPQPSDVDDKANSSSRRDLEGEAEGGLAPLNFRVSAGFRREFKTYAAQHDLKLNELLRRSFETYRKIQRD